ncbi:redoxin domain-containing protein [Mycoplasmopsis ciconiae]|uniref:Redoxin domain-containing protein n=1 Tax=Mycoplasmopsis ciconiae TaxID=561067 RepID=A0ABU7MKW2_9BACT|nr:redoxin domain-containing protein [Mycoplasmopsis ciconiae]
MKKINFGDLEVTLKHEVAKLEDKIDYLEGYLAGTFNLSKPDLSKKYTVLTTFPSIDTGVCEMQIVRMAQLSEELPHFNYIAFSLDLPSALNGYKAQHPVGNIQLFSDYKDRKMAQKTGLLIDEFQLFARSVYVLNQKGEVIYVEVLDQTKNQINFDKLKEFLLKLDAK